MSHPHREDEQPRARPAGRVAERVLLIGWDGAQWSIVRPLLADGRLPHLESLLTGGACGELVCPRPFVAASAWTSLATGKRPHEHGILHASCPTGDGSDVQPITRLGRRCAAVWNILNRAGLRTHVVGWPATHPAEEIDGVCVSEWFSVPFVQTPQVQPEGPAVLPLDVERQLRARRVAPSQVEEMTLAQVLPRQTVGASRHKQLASVCQALLAETATTFRAIRWCLRNQSWDFAACVFPAIRLCHELTRWLQSVPGSDAEIAQGIVKGSYEYHDLLLGQLIQQAGENTHIIAVSPGGHVTAKTGGADEPDDARSPVTPGRNAGFAAVCGPHVRHFVFPSKRSVLDVVPTTLALLGVAYGKDMGGRPWLDVLEGDFEPAVVDTCDVEAPDDAGTGSDESTGPVVEGSTSPNGENQSVQHLLELGYADPVEVAARESARRCRQETDLNRVISLLDAGLVSQAIATLEQLTEEHPDLLRAHEQLADAYFRANDPQSARREIDWLMGRGVELPRLYFLLGAIEFGERRFDLAIEHLRCAGRAGNRLPGLHALEGSTYLQQRDLAAAENAFQSSIELEGPNLRAHDGLAAVYLRLGRYEEAAVNALAALDKEMRFGKAHYHLGVALLHLGKPSEALHAFETWASVDPSSAAPYRWMAYACRQYLDDAPRAAAYQRQGRELVRRRREETIRRRSDDTSAPSSAP